MDVSAGNSAASLDGRLLGNLANALRGVATSPEAGKPAQPKYEIFECFYDKILVLVPNGSAIASVRYRNGAGEVRQITTSSFQEFQRDLEEILRQMGRRPVSEGTAQLGNDFGTGENAYEALAGIPMGVGGSQYRS